MVTELNLVEEDPAAFELLVEFLYRGKISEYVPKQPEEKPKTLGNTSTTKPEDEEDEEGDDLFGFEPPFASGTGRRPFQAYIEKDPTTSTNQQNAFQCVTFMQVTGIIRSRSFDSWTILQAVDTVQRCFQPQLIRAWANH